MEKPITYIGLDVHKETIAVALAKAGKRAGLFNAQFMTRIARTASSPPKAIRWRASVIFCT